MAWLKEVRLLGSKLVSLAGNVNAENYSQRALENGSRYGSPSQTCYSLILPPISPAISTIGGFSAFDDKQSKVGDGTRIKFSVSVRLLDSSGAKSGPSQLWTSVLE